MRRKPRVRLEAQMHGGGHERGMRSGTLPTHQIVGMGEAFRIAREEMASERAHPHAAPAPACGPAGIEQTFINGDLERRVPHNLNISFNYVEGESLIMGIKGLAVSSGSACTSASLEPSYVLRALGRSDELAHSSLRMTIGRFTDRRRNRLRRRRAQRIASPSCASSRRCGRCTRTASTIAPSSGRHIEFTANPLLRNHGIQRKVVDHYENPRNVGSFDKAMKTSAPAWSARRPAAT